MVLSFPTRPVADSWFLWPLSPEKPRHPERFSPEPPCGPLFLVTVESVRGNLSVPVALPSNLTLVCAPPPWTLIASCILLVCSWKVVLAGGCVRAKKGLWASALLPAGPAGKQRSVTGKLCRVGTTPRFPVEMRASRNVATSTPCSNLPVPRPKCSAATLVIPARTRALVNARLMLETPRKLLWLLITVMLVTLTTPKRLKPRPHQG